MCSMKLEIARLGVLQDRRPLLQNPSVMFLERSPQTAQLGDCKALWPAVLHQPQASQKRESFVFGKPDFDTTSWCIHAEKCKIRAFRIGGPLTATKAPIGVEKAFQPGTRLCTSLARPRFDKPGDRFLNLVALILHIEPM